MAPEQTGYSPRTFNIRTFQFFFEYFLRLDNNLDLFCTFLFNMRKVMEKLIQKISIENEWLGINTCQSPKWYKLGVWRKIKKSKMNTLCASVNIVTILDPISPLEPLGMTVSGLKSKLDRHFFTSSPGGSSSLHDWNTLGQNLNCSERDCDITVSTFAIWLTRS